MGKLIHLSDEPETVIPSGRWQPLNETLGVRAFGVNAVRVEPGEDADIEHDETHSGHQEVYVVVSGRAAFRLGEETVEAGPGDVVARIVCFGAAPGAAHPYGEWIGEEADSS